MNTKFPRGHNATISNDNGVLQYTLHNSIIAKKDDTGTYINHCGYLTNTTKTHINDFLKWLDLPFKVVQENFNWHIWNYETGEQVKMSNGWNTIPE